MEQIMEVRTNHGLYTLWKDDMSAHMELHRGVRPSSDSLIWNGASTEHLAQFLKVYINDPKPEILN